MVLCALFSNFLERQRARVCVCVCVCERERERQRDRETDIERQRLRQLVDEQKDNYVGSTQTDNKSE